MKFNTLDLYYRDQCPQRWKEDPPAKAPMDPTRELMRKVLLLKAIGRETDWNFPGIASTWDQVFWRDKDVTQQNMQESVQGVLAARQLYKKLPKENLEAFSAKNLSSSLDSGLILESSGDFMLSYPDRYETWIYMKSTSKKIRRSPLPALEHYLLYQQIKNELQKPFYLVIYYSSTKKRRAVQYRIRDERSKEECQRIAYSLTDLASKQIFYPSIGEHCKDCNINC